MNAAEARQFLYAEMSRLYTVEEVAILSDEDAILTASAYITDDSQDESR